MHVTSFSEIHQSRGRLPQQTTTAIAYSQSGGMGLTHYFRILSTQLGHNANAMLVIAVFVNDCFFK